MKIQIVQIRQDEPIQGDRITIGWNWYKCPHCKEIEIKEYDNYCPKCGFQINWITNEMV